MEPERKIEKLLRAFARKRRTEAGDAFKLHPATRRILQDAAARRVPKPNKDNLLWQLFGGLHPGFIYGASFAVLVFMAASLFLPALNKSKSRAQMSVAMGNLKQIGVATREFAEENEQQLPVSLAEIARITGTNQLTDPASGKPFVYVAGGRSVGSLRSDSVLAYSPEDRPRRAVLFADGHVEAVSRTRFSEITNLGLIQLASADVPANAPAVADNAYGAAKATESVTFALSGAALEKSQFDKLEVDRLDRKESPATVVAGTMAPAASANRELKGNAATTGTGLFFDQRSAPVSLPGQAGTAQSLALNVSNGGLQNVFKNAVASAKVAPVLANFQFQQNGAAIAVVDEDGSVYNGYVLADDAARRIAPDVAKKKLPVVTAAPPPVQNKDWAANKAAGPVEQNYFFRVTGTNRSLNQNVVFTGNVLALSNPAALAGQSGVGGNLSQSSTTNQSNQSQPGIFSNSRIEGTAVINQTNAIEINALPVVP